MHFTTLSFPKIPLANFFKNGTFKQCAADLKTPAMSSIPNASDAANLYYNRYSFIISALFNLLGTSLDQVKDHFKQLTSKQSINEDLLVNWFQILIAKLLVVSEDEFD